MRGVGILGQVSTILYRALTELIKPADAEAVPLPPTAVRNPFKGLHAFQEADGADFFGRTSIVERLVEALRDGTLLAVIGPSGAGKSSIVNAGLVPAVRAGAFGDGRSWNAVSICPGSRPFEALELGLRSVARRPLTGIAVELADRVDALADLLADGVAGPTQPLLLVLDQFEELYTQCTPEAADHLMSSLDLVGRGPSDVRVMVVLRADYYDRPLQHPRFAQCIERSTVVIAPMDTPEIRAAILEPARRVGVGFEAGLVERVLSDLVGQPGYLPLLQYALTQLFERRTGQLLTHAAYDELGGLAGAVAQRADELYLGLSPAERDTTRRCFTRLVALRDGAHDRAAAFLADLGAAVLTDPILQRFGTDRLLSFDRDPATREPTVEVAHEALLREWPRLREWIEADRDRLRVRDHLHDAAPRVGHAGPR